MTACPCCGKPWTAAERIALMFGRIVVSEHGAAPLNPRQLEVMACLLTGPMDKAEFRAAFAGGDADAANSLVARLNVRLKPTRWRVWLTTLKDAREVYAPAEILRVEDGRLGCGPSPGD